MKRILISLLGAGLLLTLLLGVVTIRPTLARRALPPDEGPAVAAYPFPAGAPLVPMGTAQGAPADPIPLREAYKSLFQRVYDRGSVAWAASEFTAAGETYAAGTLIAPLYGYFTTIVPSQPYTVPRSLALHPVKIALFYSSVRDEYDQVVTWEEGDFEQLFRVYLWSEEYFDVITETQIASGALDDYDVLILPTIRTGYTDEVLAALGDAGQQAIRDFVMNGGFLYAQGESCYLAEAVGLLPPGTVDLDTRLTDEDNVGHLNVLVPESPLTFSWLDDSTYVLNEPLLHMPGGITGTLAFSGTVPIMQVASYVDTSHPGSPAILYATPGLGKVVLMSGHPSDKLDYHPQVLDALLLAMGQRADLTGSVKQEFSTAVPDDVIPAYERVPVRVTTTFQNYWDTPMQQVVITETVSPEFEVDVADVSPTPTLFITSSEGTVIVWQVGDADPGDWAATYLAYTKEDALAKGTALVSKAVARYFDPVDDVYKDLTRRNLYVHAKMAARLNGDRDIELDGLYPLPAQGYYFDIALTLENKEETLAQNTVITDLVVLISPIVNVIDQRVIPHVLTDTATMTATGETIWVKNEVFFYDTPVSIYPLPTVNGTPASVGVMYGLSSWDGVTVYTYTGSFTTTPGFTNSITIPPTYTGYITLTPEGILLPALRLVWDFGDFQGYDYLDPAVRYGLFSQELLGRQVSFESDPKLDSGVVLEGGGGSVYTCLGGHPIPYHEYLASGVVHIPVPPEMPRVAYQDIWERDKVMELRTVFYDIVPFPPPEYHAVVNTTFELLVDRDGDGVRETRVLDYPTREPADLKLYLKSWSNFDPLMAPLEKEETLISQGMFRGLGFRIAPKGDSWWDSWSSPALQGVVTATELITVVETPAYDFLYFQQYLESQQKEAIYLTATLSTYEGVHKEGVMKIDDGARFVYHQKAVGPNRYEVFDSHVKAAFGISADAYVSKQVAPVRVATYEDTVYHFIEITDPWDPRCFPYEPILKSYGFWDAAATTYVGGRHMTTLLYPRVQPGRETQVRIEINNNTGLTFTNVSIIPQPPAGITVTLRPTVETEAIEPLFFDFPFLNLEDIPDAWKGVYYFDVQVANPFPGERGRVYEVPFVITGTNVPDYLVIPPAMIGVEDENGQVKTVWGQATNLQLADLLPPEVTPVEARLGNADDIRKLEWAIITGTLASDIDLAFQTLRDGITLTVVSTSSEGTQVSFDLPPEAELMPWLDNGEANGTLYVVLKSETAFTRSGTNLADYAPVITYTDPFSQTYSDVGNPQTVEAHGAALAVQYTVQAITGTASLPLNGLIPGQPNTITVDVEVINWGDYIASGTVLTIELTMGQVVGTLVPPGGTVDLPLGYIVWELGRDLAPADSQTGRFTLVVTPTLPTRAAAEGISYAQAAPPAPGTFRVFERTGAHFVSQYPQERPRVVDWPELAGPLDVPQGHARYTLYLPVIMKSYQSLWPTH